ncbi:hypothetical protein [Allomesorhizobium camelthorni]|uniref:Uncharacterized protein n=1 Tax=Allomesorhizobium camelthorni TaxID=475069 RepID=A0A6G4WKP7_9HYPH|nr:hypothetical protein [Mesorhizobium camelthorni]NGO55179.1 hypothetical protein [Mesorhizobium camelthorni]
MTKLGVAQTSFTQWMRANNQKIIALVLFGALLVVLALGLIDRTSPISSIEPVVATVESVYRIEPRYGLVGGYNYGLRLDSQALVMAGDQAARPHLIGSRVQLERLTRENGSIFYRFAN